MKDKIVISENEKINISAQKQAKESNNVIVQKNKNDIPDSRTDSEKNIDEESLTVGYFSYKFSAEAEMARKEQDKIVKLEKQINYDNPRQVYALYLKILSGDFFHTEEGMLYLVHLQDYLYSKEKFIPGPIPPIPYDYLRDKSKKSAEQLEQEKAALLGKVRELESDKSKAYRNIRLKQKKTDNLIYKMIIAALVLVVIVMMIISAASSSPNILNYRNQLQNEYSDWEQKLDAKEKELREREKDIEARELETISEELDESGIDDGDLDTEN